MQAARSRRPGAASISYASRCLHARATTHDAARPSIFGHRSIWPSAGLGDDPVHGSGALVGDAAGGRPDAVRELHGRSGGDYRTLGQLRAIYRRRGLELDPADDHADDLRVDRFAADMAGGQWDGEVVMRIGVFEGITLVIDGIHRGIAYLACLERGIGAERLPALCVER